MKKYLYIAAVALSAVTLTGCEDFLDSENYTESNTANFPASAADAEKQLTAVYATLNHQFATPTANYFYVSEVACDDRLGGGGENDYEAQADDHLMKATDVQFDSFWTVMYRGVFRANCAIEGLLANEASFTDKELWGQYLGEAYFLRAYFYNELSEMFGDVPLITSTSQETNIPRTPADQVYAQIASDLKKAIENMSSKPYNALMESGHATKWAAEAMMARVFLFYTGFYGKDSLPLAADGEEGTAGSVSKEDVVGWLNDCIANSGHSLVNDYRNLWGYTNEFTVDDYIYTRDATDADGNPLKWVGNDTNPESVFSIKFCNYAGWNDSYQMGYCNQLYLYFGLRSNNGLKNTFPFGQGWGQAPVSAAIWDEWSASEPNDMRMRASILNVDEEINGKEVLLDDPENPGSPVIGEYIYGADKQMEEAGYWNKKMIPILAVEALPKAEGAWNNSLFWVAYDNYDKSNNGNNMQGAHYCDLLVIRYADVLLMHSELTGTADKMNMVRARAGLDPVAYSLEALQRERRHELCFEGRRWADIRRWGIATEMLKEQNGRTLYNKGVKTKMTDGKYEARYKATNGFFPIPKAQVDLAAGNLVQNPGWEDASANYNSWNF